MFKYLKQLTSLVAMVAVLFTFTTCLLYTSDAADDTPCVDLGGRRIIKICALSSAG